VKESKAIAEKMSEILLLPEISDLYLAKPQRRIFNERDLLVKPKHYTDVNKVVRPDRVVIDEDTNQVYIIDYKTGLPNISHHAQVEKYAQQFIEMGYSKVDKLLIYTEILQVVRV
jgi:ATP-dependent exoDNAse (exonuclease V) beta subunit